VGSGPVSAQTATGSCGFETATELAPSRSRQSVSISVRKSDRFFVRQRPSIRRKVGPVSGFSARPPAPESPPREVACLTRDRGWQRVDGACSNFRSRSATDFFVANDGAFKRTLPPSGINWCIDRLSLVEGLNEGTQWWAGSWPTGGASDWSRQQG